MSTDPVSRVEASALHELAFVSGVALAIVGSVAPDLSATAQSTLQAVGGVIAAAGVLGRAIETFSGAVRHKVTGK